MSSDLSPLDSSPDRLARGRLRLFAAPLDDAPRGEPLRDRPNRPSPDWRVRDFWSGYVLPVVGKSCDWSSGTIQAYADAVDYWSELTRDWSLSQIDEFETAEFVGGLRRQPGRADEFLSTETVRKHCAAMQRLLNLAGPRMRSSKKDLRRFAARLIDEVPWIEPPDAEESFPDGDFTHEEVLAILTAIDAGQARITDDYRGDPIVFWRALVTFLCGTGCRIGETMALTWSMIDRQLLLIPGMITKAKKPRRKFLHADVLAAIEPLRGMSERIFPWPNWPRPGAHRWLQRRREQLLVAAGLPEGRQFGFHGFRKYYVTQIYNEGDEAAAQAAAGHASVATTLGYYVNGQAQATRAMAREREAVERLPLFR